MKLPNQPKKLFGVGAISLGLILVIGGFLLPFEILTPVPTTPCKSLNSWQDYITEFTIWKYNGMNGSYDSQHPVTPATMGYVSFSNPHIGGYSQFSCGDSICNLPTEQDTTNPQVYCPQDCSSALLLVGDVTATNGMTCSAYIVSYNDGLLISEFYKTINGISVFRGLYSEFYNSLLWCDPTDRFMFIAKPPADDIVEMYSNELCQSTVTPPCQRSRDCWDRFQSCYYMCQDGQCSQIQTFAPLYYPNCGGTTEEDKCWNSGGVWMKGGVWSVDASKTPIRTEQDCNDFNGMCFVLGAPRPISLTSIGQCSDSSECLHADVYEDTCIYRSGTTTTTIDNSCWYNSHCIWCGQSCVKYQAGMMCPTVMPPAGYDCKCVFNPPMAETGKCQAVSSKPICCHSWGYGSGMVKCCHKYEWKTSGCGELLIGGGSEIVDDSFCVTTTTIPDCNFNGVCDLNENQLICPQDCCSCGYDTQARVCKFCPVTTTTTRVPTTTTTTTIPQPIYPTKDIGMGAGGILILIGLGLLFL